MKTVIMAGGKGTRISSVASDIPKPMIKIEGKPVLEHELECLRDQGFTDIILTVSHLGNIIMDYFGDGSGISPVTGKPFGVHIEFYFEKEPLGNAGALFKIKDKLTSDFLLLNADAVFDVDFNRFVAFHREHGGLVTLFTHPNSHPYDSGLIIADKSGAVEKWLAKEDERPEYYRNRVNAGLHVINPAALELSGIDANKVGTMGENGKPIKADLDRQLLNGGKLLVAGNGGSAADAEHIVGELMKGFKLPRKPEADFAEKLVEENQELGSVLAENLQGALPAIALDGHPALSTAYMNDCEPLLCFAQQVNGYGKSGDVFLGISTSGNSKNVLYAATTAHAKGMKVIGLTGAKDSKLKDMSDVCIKAPQTETYMIQELHLPIYHCLCLMLEDNFFA